MRFFKQQNGEIFAFDDTYNTELIHPDLTPITREEKDLLLAPPPRTKEELLKELEDVVQNYLNTIPIQENFLTPTNFTQYLGYPNEFRLKAEHVGAFFAQVWGYSNTEKAKLLDGTRTMPTPEEYLSELPQYTPYAGT